MSKSSGRSRKLEREGLSSAHPVGHGRAHRGGAIPSILLGVASLVAFVAIGESSLRLLRVQDPEEREEIFSGFAGASPLFFECRDGGRRVYRTSPNRLEYFNQQEFPARKPAGAIRVFAFGGSTTFGEPWGHRGAFAHYLERSLARGLPGRDVQVVNAGGKGYGSTAVFEVVREALRYEPDAFVFYLGQNEFREAAFHPIERSGRSSVRAWQAFLHRQSRIYLATRRLLLPHLPARRRGARPTSFATREVAGILARPFGPESFRFPQRLAIPPITSADASDSEVFSRFGENLESMFALATARGVPCLALTQLANEQFWYAPNRSRVASDRGAEYETRYRNLLDAISAGRYEEALPLVDSVAALYAVDRDSYLHVLEGDLFLSLGRAADARAAYRTAWADDRVNATLRLATTAAGVPLIESEPWARAAVPDSILGFAAFYDELHPSPVVHRALGRAAFEAMAAAGMLPLEDDALAETADSLPTDPDAEVLAYESLRALYLGDWARAESAAQEAAAIAPRLGKASVYLGICAMHRGDLEAARRNWDALARLYPELRPAGAADAGGRQPPRP